MFTPGFPESTLPLLVGRDRELAVLHERFAAARAGQGSLVLIGGEAGIGKTALAEAVCTDVAEQGALVLPGRCFDLAETPAYGPWLYLFERYHPSTHLPPHPPAFAEPGIVGAVASQAILFRQLLDFLRALIASQPVVLLLDDLHWADPASLDLLRFLARSLDTLPILMLVTYRSDELTPHHPLSHLLPALVHEARTTRLDLRALDDKAVRALVTTRYDLAETDTRRLVVYVQGRAEGNAFYLSELLRSLEETGVIRCAEALWALGDLTHATVPPLLRQVIESRLARLDEECRRLLALAAVIGHEVPLAVWMAVSEADEETILTVVERGVNTRLLVEMPDGARVRFGHALIREAIYEVVPAMRRRRLHRRVGDVLLTDRYPDPDAVANHFVRAMDARAVAWLIKSGEQSQAAFAWITAAARFEAAVALIERMDTDTEERGWLLMRIASLLRYGDVPKAEAFARAALVVGEGSGDRALVAYARFQRGILACFSGEVLRGLVDLEASIGARAALSDSEQERFTARVAALAAGNLNDWRVPVVSWFAHIGRLREAQALGEQLLRETETHRAAMPMGEASGDYGLAIAYAALGMPDEAAAIFARTCDAYVRAGNHLQVASIQTLELIWITLPYRTEDIAGRRRLAAMAVAAVTRASGTSVSSLSSRFCRLPLLIPEGEWEEAEHLAVAASEEERGHIYTRSFALQYLAMLALLWGNVERAWWAVREVLPAGSAAEPGTVTYCDVATTVQRVAVALALDAGDLPSARGWLDAHNRWLNWSGMVLGQSEGHMLWARYYQQTGEMDKAHDHAKRGLDHATEPRQPLALLAAHRLLGELATDAGRFDDAAAHLDASLQLAVACAAPYERALTLLALAALHAATGNEADALAGLETVRAICTPLGAAPALARANDIATRLAAQAAPQPNSPDGLTARERDVLRLVAAGMSNRQIAMVLFISERTVNRHITNLYTKIDAHSKADATAYAIRHQLA